MDYKIIKQLDENKNVNSVNRDFTTKILLDRDVKNLTEDDVTHYLNSSEQFDIERQNSNKYFIYGGLEFFSILNGITTNYSIFKDFFDKYNFEENQTTKTIFNTFDFYLLKPLTHESENNNYELLYDNYYLRKFEVIGVNSDFIINNQAFAKNIFNDEKHSYLINKDIVLENNLDWFGKPITELYIMSVYKKSYTGTIKDEEVFSKEVEVVGDEINGYNIVSNYVNITGDTYYDNINEKLSYQIGDIITGDVVIWNKEIYNETKFIDKEIKIITNYEEVDDNYTNNKRLIWKYKPLLPIRIDYLANEYNVENISGTTEVTIPNHAIELDDMGNYIWRDKLDKGFIDNLYNIGVDYPFVNGKHYIYSNHIIKLVPDLDDIYTDTKFQSLIMNGYDSIDNNTNIDNYGELC